MMPSTLSRRRLVMTYSSVRQCHQRQAKNDQAEQDDRDGAEAQRASRMSVDA